MIISEIVAACRHSEGPGAAATTQVRLGTGGCLRLAPCSRPSAACWDSHELRISCRFDVDLVACGGIVIVLIILLLLLLFRALLEIFDSEVATERSKRKELASFHGLRLLLCLLLGSDMLRGVCDVLFVNWLGNFYLFSYASSRSLAVVTS